LRKGFRPRDIEVFSRQLLIARLGSNWIQKHVSQNHVSGLFYGRGEQRVLIAGLLELLHFLKHRRRNRSTNFSLQFFKRLAAGVCFGRGESKVKSDHARAASAQLVD
jgi:hypothetical protein